MVLKLILISFAFEFISFFKTSFNMRNTFRPFIIMLKKIDQECS